MMSELTAATSDDVRRLNLSRTLRHVHLSGRASRSELVSVTGLNRSTVAVLVNELTAAGLIAEVQGPGGSVGRPSLVVAPVSTSAVVTVFDLRVERTVAAAIGLGGVVLKRLERAHRRSRLTPQSAAQELADLSEALFDDVPNGSAWVGLGISVPGIADSAQGLVRRAPNLGWVDVAFADLVQEAFVKKFGGCPQVSIGNDANLGAIAESARGVGRELTNVIFLSGDVGIGGGVIVEGKLMTGASGFGGEVGHMVVSPNGRECRCGARGCWETEVGSPAVLRALGRDPESDDLGAVMAEETWSDAKLESRLRELKRWISIGLVNLTNAFNPEVIVLGGHLGTVLERTAFTSDDLLTGTLSGDDYRPLLATPMLGGDSSLIGASEVAFAELLNDPLNHVEHSHRLVAS